MNSICLLEAEKNGKKQNNLIINLTTENRLYISGMDTSMKTDSVDNVTISAMSVNLDLKVS